MGLGLLDGKEKAAEWKLGKWRKLASIIVIIIMVVIVIVIIVIVIIITIIVIILILITIIIIILRPWYRFPHRQVQQTSFHHRHHHRHRHPHYHPHNCCQCHQNLHYHH